MFNKKMKLPEPAEALKGRTASIPTAKNHFVSGRPLKGPYPDGFETAIFALGCYWGAERLFWETPGVWVTAAGFAGGTTPNPTYQESCTGLTGHAEAVLVVFDPSIVSYEDLLAIFWEAHDPTQGMRQGNDVGTCYRSGLYPAAPGQLAAANASRDAYQAALRKAGRDTITTEIKADQTFYFAEEFHQQYLAKNPDGYCNMRGTGVSCPIPARA
ncbi:MAG: peptide-methionine (S)-S-oxide reductase MsrA [Rhizobiaceae bacterium]